MNEIKYFFIFLVLGISSISARTIHTLTLHDVLQQTLSVSPQLKEAERQISGAEARVNISQSSDYPTASAQFSYARVSPVSSVAFGPATFQLNPANNYDGHVEVNAILYDFDKRSAATEVSKTGVTTARDRLELTKEGLAYQTAKLFYTILFIQKSIDVHNEEIRTLNEHLAITKKKIESGTATDFDVLTIQVRIAAALNKKVDLTNALQRAEIQLKESLHFPNEDSLQLSGSFDSVSAPQQENALLKQAFSSRIELQAVENSITAASIQKNLASLGNYPSLNFHFSYGLKNGLIPNIDVLRGNYVAALGLSVPLFDGFKKDYQLDEAEANLNAVQEHKNVLAQQIQTEVRLALATVSSNQEKVRIAQFNIEQAKKALEIARIRYNAGTVTNLDLLDAETSLTEAQFQEAQALYNVVISSYELKQAAGEKIF
ncbi:MAG: TolC family protein [Bacteroidetes bacterium]|nr:TolC family protein [Bacteroidota bacterium]